MASTNTHNDPHSPASPPGSGSPTAPKNPSNASTGLPPQTPPCVVPGVELVDITLLRPHEHTRPKREEEIFHALQEDGELHKPLTVDLMSKTLLDGHHRYNALLRSNCKRAPVFWVNYDHESIQLEPGADGNTATKQQVRERAKDGHLFEPKSTKHVVVLPGEGTTRHLSEVVGEHPTPLEILR